MSDRDFLRSIFKVGGKLKGRKLSEREKEQIIEKFNDQSGSAYDRAYTALSEVLGLPKKRILEKRSSVSDIDRVLNDLRDEAERWQSSKD